MNFIYKGKEIIFVVDTEFNFVRPFVFYSIGSSNNSCRKVICSMKATRDIILYQLGKPQNSICKHRKLF